MNLLYRISTISEYDNDLTSEGDIEVVEIYLRHWNEASSDYRESYDVAIATLLNKIEAK